MKIEPGDKVLVRILDAQSICQFIGTKIFINAETGIREAVHLVEYEGKEFPVDKSEIFLMEKAVTVQKQIEAIENSKMDICHFEDPGQTKIDQWDWVKDLRSSETLKIYKLVISEKTGKLVGFLGRDRFEKKNTYIPLEHAFLEAKADPHFGLGLQESKFQTVPPEFEDLNENELLFLSAFRKYPVGTVHDLVYMRQWMGSNQLRDKAYSGLIQKGFAYPFVQNVGRVHLTNKGYNTAKIISYEIYESLIVTENELARLAHWMFSFEAEQNGYKKSFSKFEIIKELCLPMDKEFPLIKRAIERGIIIPVPPKDNFILGPNGILLIERALFNNSK